MKCKRCTRVMKTKDGFVRIGNKKYYVCDFCVDLLSEMNLKAQEVAYNIFIMPIKKNENQVITH